MSDPRPLSIPVILGTTRKGRTSANAARFVFERLSTRPGVVSELLDLRDLDIPVDDAGEGARDPRFAAAMERADGIVIVSPEYNHSFPGLLKHVLDTCLKEYIHKAAGIVGVSAGIFGGARVIEHFQPVLRELGLVSIFWDMNFGSVEKTFDSEGRLLDQAYIRRADKFIGEILWMARVLRYGRENVSLE